MPTINNSIPYIPENVIDQAAAINEALNDIDVALQIEVEGVYNAPPTLTNGESVIVGSTPTDEFVGHSNEIAQRFDGYWKFYPDIVYCLNKDDGNFWKKISGIWEASNKVSWGNIEGTLSDQTDLQDALDEKLNASEVGISVASLVAGKVPSEQLPSYVDDILEFPDLASFPVTGESGKIYVAIDTGNGYRWSGSTYVKISQPLEEIPQATIEAGTDSNLFALTARRVRQANAAWWASITNIDGKNIGATTAGTGRFTTLTTTGDATLGDSSSDTVVVNGVMAVGHIRFPAVQIASADANTLDDYEEGAFTPMIVGDTTPGVGTYSTQVGRYVKVGKLVNFHIRIKWSAHTGTGNMRVSGLPFNKGGLAPVSVASIVPISGLSVPVGAVLSAYMNTGVTNEVAISAYLSGSNTGVTPIAMDPDADISLSGQYEV